MNTENVDPDYSFIISMRRKIRESVYGNKNAEEMIEKYNKLNPENLTVKQALTLGYELAKQDAVNSMTKQIKELLND